MGVDILKQIITGALFTKADLSQDFVDKYYNADSEKTFGEKVRLFQLNPWGGETVHTDYMIGVVDKEEDEGDRAQAEDKELLQEIELNKESFSLVKEQLEKHHLIDNSHPIKTYRIQYYI